MPLRSVQTPLTKGNPMNLIKNNLPHPETYIIYGANSHIGSELSHYLQPLVSNLVLFYHKNNDKINDLLSCANVHGISSDIRDYADYVKQLETIFSQSCLNLSKSLGAVYFPATRSYDHQPLSSTSLEITKEIIEVNLLGCIHFLKGIINLELSNSEAVKRIVLLGSHVSRTGLKDGSVYSCTKAAVANLTRSVSMEVGSKHVFINTVSPGPVVTQSVDFSSDYAEFREKYFATELLKTSLNKLASVDDVCSLILYLTSELNLHLTGEELFITGGTL